MLATLKLRTDKLAQMRRWANIGTDAELAARSGLDPATISRVINGRIPPSSAFIAGLLGVFGPDAFPDLFSVVTDEALSA